MKRRTGQAMTALAGALLFPLWGCAEKPGTEQDITAPDAQQDHLAADHSFIEIGLPDSPQPLEIAPDESASPELSPENVEVVKFCGDGVCSTQIGEDCNTCPEDCDQCSYTCGDQICELGETAELCPPDCGPCGDGYCGKHEQIQEACPVDCLPNCGNTTCDGGETGQPDGPGLYCPVDCGFCGDDVCGYNDLELCAMDCPAGCGDGTCEEAETSSICPMDCIPCGDDVCAPGEDCPEDCERPCLDGICSGNETTASCPGDCGPCGDGVCSLVETESGHCQADCPAGCGDQQCAESEDAATCPADCA